MGDASFFIGVDWGTHSSKWCVTDSGGQILDWPVLSSDLYCEGDNVTFSAQVDSADEDRLCRELKGILIKDPMGDFWGGHREDTQTSLGNSVCLSLCSLLTGATRSLLRERPGVDLANIEFGFSFPNWIAVEDRKSKVAASHFCQAVEAAVHILANHDSGTLPRPGVPYPVAQWADIVTAARAARPSARSITIEDMTRSAFDLGGGGPPWRFLVESGAAGLPYLRRMAIDEVPGLPGAAKLLVVDVGAGSTDVGYMLRFVAPRTNRENFYYFRPASSFPEAGGVLTTELKKHYQLITNVEAELMKMRSSDWHTLSFVQSWIRRISAHVNEYMMGVKDQRWLPESVRLEIIVTGGSGLVPGLKDAIRESTIEALRARHCRRPTNVQVSDDYGARLQRGTEAEIAQRAVSIGAADPDKPGFQYVAEMTPSSETHFQVARNPWVR